MRERDISFEIGGKQYRQDYLKSKQALRLHHKIARLGFVPAAEALAKSGAKVPDASALADPDFAATMLKAAYDFVHTVEPEDIEGIYDVLAKVTFIDTSDGRTEQRLDAVTEHFADARDMFRYYEFIVQGCKAQLSPFFSELNTRFGSTLPR